MLKFIGSMFAALILVLAALMVAGLGVAFSMTAFFATEGAVDVMTYLVIATILYLVAFGIARTAVWIVATEMGLK